MNNVNLLPPWWVFLAVMGGCYLLMKMKMKNKTEDTAPGEPFDSESPPLRKKIEDTAPGDISDSETTPVDTETPDPFAFSSSSSSHVHGVLGHDYEVFLSFRGPDTRRGFTNHLYTNLKEAGINVFLDDEKLHVGKEISGKLLEAIEQSRIFIPIFSKNYACSKWCLMELAHVVKCMDERKRLVLPIFYDVTPGVVKDQSGTYKDAFEEHCKHHDGEKVGEWRDSLRKIGHLEGWELEKVTNG